MMNPVASYLQVGQTNQIPPKPSPSASPTLTAEPFHRKADALMSLVLSTTAFSRLVYEAIGFFSWWEGAMQPVGGRSAA